MVEFHSKFESRNIKIARVNSIALPNLSIYFNSILHGVRVRCDRGRFSVHSPFIEMSMAQIIIHGNETLIIFRNSTH